MSTAYCTRVYNKFTLYYVTNYDVTDNAEELMGTMENLYLCVKERNICRHFEIVASLITAIFYETVYNLRIVAENLNHHQLKGKL